MVNLLFYFGFALESTGFTRINHDYFTDIEADFTDIVNGNGDNPSTREATLKNTLQWRHNESDGVSNLQIPDCLLNRLFKA